VANDLENLLPRAFMARAERPMKNDSADIDGYSTLLVKVEVDGAELVAVFTVQRKADGRQFYNAVTLADGQKKPR